MVSCPLARRAVSELFGAPLALFGSTLYDVRMTNTTTINAAIEIKEGLARIEDLKQELARANEDLWHDHVRHLEDDLKYGGTVSWPCSDCGEPITIKKVETLLFIIRSGGHYCHGDC